MYSRKKRAAMSYPYHPMIRPTATSPVLGCPLVDQATLFVMHRINKRSVPCSGPDCRFCYRLAIEEERIFLPIMETNRQEICIVDLPGSHIESLNGHAERFQTLRRSVLLIQRKAPRDNAPILLRARALKDDEIEYAPFNHLVAYLDEFFARNVEYAVSSVIDEKSIIEDAPGRTIARSSDV